MSICGGDRGREAEHETAWHGAGHASCTGADLPVQGTVGGHKGAQPPLAIKPPPFPAPRVGSPSCSLLPPPAAQPSPGRALADKKPVLPEAWNINFDTEKGIFYYPGIFLHLFRDLLTQPPPPAASLFRQLKPTLQLTLLVLPRYRPQRGVFYVGKCLLYPPHSPSIVCMLGAGGVAHEAPQDLPSCSPSLW